MQDASSTRCFKDCAITCYMLKPFAVSILVLPIIAALILLYHIQIVYEEIDSCN